MLTTQDIKTAVSRYWGGRAVGFDQGASHGVHNEVQHRAWLDLLREVAGPPPLKVLDVGCGTGFLAMRMAELGHTAVGVDLSEDMLAEARRKTEGTGLAVTFQLGDAEASPARRRPLRRHSGAPCALDPAPAQRGDACLAGLAQARWSADPHRRDF